MHVEQIAVETTVLDSPTRKIAEWRDVGADVFRREILTRNEPAVLRGIATHWPLVAASRTSSETLVNYLCALDNGEQFVTVTAEPEVMGRLGYVSGSKSFNHRHTLERLPDVLAKLLSLHAVPEAPAIWIAGLPADKHLPRLRGENDTDLAPPEAEPHLTICNAVTVPAHIDAADNIAIVVAGRRRFTVFPPDQATNLYIGPLDPTPAGVPISLVSQDAPDFARYPRYRIALEAAYVADLEPGDGIFIPYLWWHGVQSLDRFNMLVNFWWYSHETATELPWIPLLNACHHLFRDMPPHQRLAWRALFDYWVFGKGDDPVAHLAPDQHSAALSAETVAKMRDRLAELLA